MPHSSSGGIKTGRALIEERKFFILITEEKKQGKRFS
jgi:hypothetical protein